MAPTAISSLPQETPSYFTKPTLNNILVVGSLNSAQDGSYQSLISELTTRGQNVEKQLLDRITDNGEVTESF